MLKGLLVTAAGRTFALDEIGTAVTQAEAPGRQGKGLLIAENQKR